MGTDVRVSLESKEMFTTNFLVDCLRLNVEKNLEALQCVKPPTGKK